MSLFMPMSTEQIHSRPMAISTITSPVNSYKSSRKEIHQDNLEPSNTYKSPSQFIDSDITSPSTFFHYKETSPSSTTFSSPNYSTWSTPSPPNPLYTVKDISKSNPMCKSQINVTQARIINQSSYSPFNHRKKIPIPYGLNSKSISSYTILSDPPLSLQERRLRNKTASAKYRAKKNQQHSEMRIMINSLTKENELLLRQLENIQYENSHLRDTCDKLRGKLLAQKMLKNYLDENKLHQNLDDKALSECLS